MSHLRRFFPLLVLLSLCLSSLTAQAELIPVDPWQAEALPDPDPAGMTWSSSLAGYGGLVFYAGEDMNIHALDPVTNQTTLVCDLSADENFYYGAAAFLVSSDGRLWFTDNGMSANLYRLDLTGAWPAEFEALDTQCAGSMYSLAAHPTTGNIWFSSADFLEGNDFYLYEVSADFDAATLNVQFEKPHSGGNGPIIFEDEDTLLYGESPWGGDGYFHRVNTATGTLAATDAMTFAGGLATAVVGYNDEIYVSTGAGGEVLRLADDGPETVANLDMQAQGLTFLNNAFFLTEMNGDDGSMILQHLWHADPDSIGQDTDGDGGSGGGGCTLATTSAPGLEWLLLALMPLLLRLRRFNA